ncbi:MAG: type II toxin-antitoxin system VapC family toxin [Coriobacteriia bacterium]|nr:type II toxin-antitoxin system VapC family toxin [Coriobacteriia bacterium]
MYLLDSCICIDFIRGRTPEFYAFLRTQPRSSFALPAIVLHELETGVRKSAHPKKEEARLQAFAAPFAVAPFDEACAYKAAEIRAMLEKRGERIGAYDVLIAATALANNAILATNNVREFKRVPGLQIETWDVISLD